MLLSTQTHSLACAFGDIEAVRILAANGFEAVDYSMFGMENPSHFLNQPSSDAHIEGLRRAAGELGVIFNQSHAPFPSYIAGKDDYNVNIAAGLRRSIEVTGMLGAKIVIIHPVTFHGEPERQKQFNLELYEGLRPTLRACGVKAALENMFRWDSAAGRIGHAACSEPEQFCEYLDALGYDDFTACLDIGHCGLVGNAAADMIRALGHDRLGSLHVHDNNMESDLHTLPFLHKVDWKAVCKALRDINYKGEFTLEADNFLSAFPNPLKPSASRLMSEVGHHLVRLIENS